MDVNDNHDTHLTHVYLTVEGISPLMCLVHMCFVLIHFIIVLFFLSAGCSRDVDVNDLKYDLFSILRCLIWSFYKVRGENII